MSLRARASSKPPRCVQDEGAPAGAGHVLLHFMEVCREAPLPYPHEHRPHLGCVPTTVADCPDRAALHVLPLGLERQAVGSVGGNNAKPAVEQQHRLANGVDDRPRHRAAVVAVHKRLTVRPRQSDPWMTVRYQERRVRLHSPRIRLRNDTRRESARRALVSVPARRVHRLWGRWRIPSDRRLLRSLAEPATQTRPLNTNQLCTPDSSHLLGTPTAVPHDGNLRH